MSNTINTATAVLKRKFAAGLSKAMYNKFPFFASIAHHEDFTGLNKQVPIQIERGQASAASAPIAIGLSATASDNYQQFLLTRNNHYTVGRLAGDAMEASKDDAGAFVRLLDNGSNQSAQGELLCNEQYAFGAGNGVLGTIASGTTTPTIILDDVLNGLSANIANFSVGQTLVAVSDKTLSPTVRTGNVTVTGINRQTGTLTVVGNWNDPGNIPGITVGDSLTRLSDNAVGGVNNVYFGALAYISGTASTLYGNPRTADVVRLCGQQLDAAGQPMEDALVTAWGMRAQQFVEPGKMVAWCNPLDMAQLLKSTDGKVQYTRIEMNSKYAAISFQGIDLMTTQGPIRLMTSPFVSRGYLYLLDLDTFAIESLGQAPHLLSYGGGEILRVASDDAVEWRFGSRLAMSNDNPSASVVIFHWGQ